MAKRIEAPGIYPDFPEADYHADPCPVPSLSSGTMHRILTSSDYHAFYNHPRFNPDLARDDKDVYDRGHLAHCMLLGGLEKIVSVDPNDFPGQKGGIPEGWTNAAIKAERERIRAMGKIPVFKNVYEQAYAMRDRALAKIDRCPIPIKLEDGQAEVTAVWTEGDTWCRIRVDWWSLDRMLMLDYKSTAGLAEPGSWGRRMMGPMGYDVQKAHYCRGGHQTTGEHPEWLFLVQENFPPYECAFVGMSTAMEEVAEHKRQYAMDRWAYNMKRKLWPGYTDEIAFVEPTTWQMEEAETLNLDNLDA